MITEKDTKIDITPALEDYLKAILNLYEKGGFVRVTDVAEKLNVTKPTACQTIGKLNIQGIGCKGKLWTFMVNGYRSNTGYENTLSL